MLLPPRCIAAARNAAHLNHTFYRHIAAVRNVAFRNAAQLTHTSSRLLSWPARVADPHSRLQAYISTSPNPVLNLSIEHFLFQTSPPGSRILFLYTNSPSIILGRNQNPWSEVNLSLLSAAPRGPQTEPPDLGAVALVRRRSGGGTVFHDGGNVNWSVICDLGEFTRDKHAEMVVRALRELGVERARVNERHDIVLDQGATRRQSDTEDTHRTPWTDPDAPPPLKVSGSAYKLARNRALHHGTALLGSPNLHVIPDYLHSPAKGLITSKGVASVSSPVGNIGVENGAFEDAVRDEFLRMYAADVEAEVVGEQMLEVPEVKKGYVELKSPEWTYLQTPQFTFSTPVLERIASGQLREGAFTMSVRYGVITSISLEGLPGTLELANFADRRLHEVQSWKDFLHGLDLEVPVSHGHVSLPSFLTSAFPPTSMCI
ncbi:hypothetical protein EJ06DRAFT_557769 [Trichodelitschia bisporula]|uniref:Putative lipoate-protein ligase A n=1 Tax=Trichodelitschia bisporula TaxID=703511 RepID=A0A6G1HTX4_9PEZI|nr:hypothetical protein EJ06DRAFT_557769 [Trichodelitschia bisporula]